MNLSDYPKPPADSGLGIHGGANAWFPLGEHEEAENWNIAELKAMGFSWLKLLNIEGSALRVVRKCKENGIEPIVRLYRHQPNPGTLDDNPKTKSAVPELVLAGCRYMEPNNEPNLNVEWRNEQMPMDAPQQVARDFRHDADYILACGGVPLIPAMAPGGNWDDMDFLRGVILWLKDNWGLDKLSRCALAVHNAALNHPLDYPYDAINQSAENAGQELLDPGASNGWLKFAAVHELCLRETGLNLPVLSTEGGIWPGDHQDPRYPAVTKEAVTDGYAQIRADMRAGKYPDWYFCTGYWLMANRGMGNPDMSFEYQTWFNCDGTRIASVDRYKADGAFTRPVYVEPEPEPPEPDEWPAVLSDMQIATLVEKHRFPADYLDTMTAVVLAESGGNRFAVGYNRDEAGNVLSEDIGLAQINSGWIPDLTAAGIIAGRADLFDPDKNMAAAKYIFDIQGIEAWCAYTAETYVPYLDRAHEVVQNTPLAEAIRNAAWNHERSIYGIPYTPGFAFPEYARQEFLGAPLTGEWGMDFEGVRYIIQAYVQGIVFAKEGDWANVRHIDW